jgi:hypothetical protein
MFSTIRVASSMRAVLRVLLLTLPILALFAATVFGCAIGIAWLRFEDLRTFANWQLATVCALTVWLFVAIFHLRRMTLTVEVADGSVFLRSMRTELEELGYLAKRSGPWTYFFAPAFQSLAVSGGIRAHASAGIAHITGPKMLLDRIRGRIRLHAYARSARNASDSSRLRRDQHLLKRVQISFRLPDKSVPVLPADVVRILTEEGAQVTYEVNILAHSSEGIRDSVVDGLVRDQLTAQSINAAVRKEPFSSWDLDLAEAVR